jgi:hypothetical protein
MICQHCEEPIRSCEQYQRYMNGPVEHIECFRRRIYGSVAHIMRRCSCYVPGASENDDPRLTKREAARAAVHAWESLQRRN